VLCGRPRQDPELLNVLVDVHGDLAEPEVLHFLHLVHVDEVHLSPGRGNEGDAARTLVQSGGAEAVEVAEVCHRGLMRTDSWNMMILRI
jgi:hypothetical protein